MTISDCILQSFSSFHMTWNVKPSIFNHKRETYSNVTAVLPRTVLCPHSPHCWSVSPKAQQKLKLLRGIICGHVMTENRWVNIVMSFFLSTSLHLFQCLLGLKATSWWVVTWARGLADIWPLTGCAADPGGYNSTMGGTCLGPVAMGTYDRSETVGVQGQSWVFFLIFVNHLLPFDW